MIQSDNVVSIMNVIANAGIACFFILVVSMLAGFVSNVAKRGDKVVMFTVRVAYIAASLYFLSALVLDYLQSAFSPAEVDYGIDAGAKFTCIVGLTASVYLLIRSTLYVKRRNADNDTEATSGESV